MDTIKLFRALRAKFNNDGLPPGIVMLIRSSVLNDLIICASDDARVPPTPYAIYRVSELKLLIDAHLDPEIWRDVHQIRKVFPKSQISSVLKRAASR